jgi:hypothetical protein
LAVLILVWSPPVGDLAAQVFRTELFQQAGLAIWNGSWYGGHYTLTYSLIFPPLAALLGPQVVGGLAVVSSSYLFDRLVRDRWGIEARWATLWFAAGVVTLLADGQLTFALGVALGLASLRCLQVGRGRLAVLAAAACALSSPVAAVFLAGVVLAGAWERGRRVNRFALAAGAVALVLTIAPNLAFPEPGQFPFVFSSFVAIPLWCGGALYIIRGLPEERQLRRVILGYLLASALIWLTPNALGGNAVRLGALFGGPVLAAVVLSRRPRVAPWLLALAMAGSLYWQLTASVSQIARSVGDPSTTPEYFEPAASWLREHGGQGLRIEVPPTANHWESAYLAPKLELARGWLRQLDTTRDDIFYDEGGLTNRAYSSWLRGNAITYVALPDAPLDYSSTAERRLILGEPGYLTLRYRSEHWRIYQVRDPKPLVAPLGAAGAAQTMWIGRQGFALDVTTPGEFLVRVNFTPYWSISRGSGCILRHGDWTVARASQPGVFRVDANFSLGRAWNAVTGARKTC